jgi:type VI secretion system protein VasJ
MPSFREQLSEKLTPFQAAIAGENSAGPDLTYDAAFDGMRMEVEKLNDISGATPAWSIIVELGYNFVGQRSKDFRVAAWWTIAKMRTEGLPGLAEGLLGLHVLSTTYWETLYPPLKRARARGNLTSWLAEQVEAFLNTVPPLVTADKDAIELVHDLYNELDALWSDKLGDAYGGMAGLRGLLRTKVAEVPPPPPPPAPAAEPGAPAAATGPDQAAPGTGDAPAAAAAPIALPTMASAADAPKVLRALGSALRDAAYELRKADPAQAYAYRVQRIGMWIAVSAVPPADGGKTKVPAPGKDVQKRLDGFVEGEKWMELLDAAESNMGQFIYWFDLHRYSAMAMDRLGALFLDARQTLGRELAAFLALYPQLTKLKFADGTPFADPATGAWLEEELPKHAGGGGKGGGAAAGAISEEDKELAARFEQAKELVLKGETGEGLGLAVGLASRGADERTRFRSKLAASRLAIQGNRLDVAQSLLADLASVVERHGLETWEPSLAAGVYSSLLFCLSASKTKDEKQKEALFSKLCRLDPAGAIRLLDG